MTLIEATISIAIISILIFGIAKLTGKAINLKNMSATLKQSDKIMTALEITYRQNILYVEANTYGWTEGNGQNLSILPIKKDATTLTLRTYSSDVLQAWTDAGCTVTVTVDPAYDLTCKDDYGLDIQWTSTANEHAANTLYKNGYNRTPYTIDIRAGETRKIDYSWSAGYLDSEYLEKNSKKSREFISAINTYHTSRLTHEAIVNTGDSVNGGLATSDDVLVAWVWEVWGNPNTQECTGKETSDWGCSNHTNAIWFTDSAYLTADSKTEIDLLITRLGVTNTYRTDSFGNPVAVRVFSDNAGAAIAAVPPRPRPSYYNCLPGGDSAQCGGLTFSVSPPYRGALGVLEAGAWITRETIIYPQ